ncbi:MAG: serine protein kinase, partial [Pirellulales bacterium]|nr:serine protein kinase [Pirellulales bacterium]
MSGGREILDLVVSGQDQDQFQKQNWTGSFEQYLDIVRQDPKVTRNAYERVYDMIMGFGVETFEGSSREKLVRYRFFDDPDNHGEDAVYGLVRPLAALVKAFESAAKGYGIEKRVLLLHGPVGSSKSTIARLLKKGLERYSATDEGALYSLGWVPIGATDDIAAADQIEWCPMNEEPLHLIPEEMRKTVLAQLNAGRGEDDYQVTIRGDLCPFCRHMYNERLRHYEGDWRRVVQDVRVRRLILSEKDRIGIGTFQPKDEKNQDSTELTGDINYRKIAEYGSDSDPRAFNFDG